jgi:hypothetical protein
MEFSLQVLAIENRGKFHFPAFGNAKDLAKLVKKSYKVNSMFFAN